MKTKSKWKIYCLDGMWSVDNGRNRFVCGDWDRALEVVIARMEQDFSKNEELTSFNYS